MAAGDIALAITISAVDQASGVVGNIGNAISQLAGGGALGAIATGAAAAATALVGVGVQATTAAGNFQQSLTQLVTSAGETQSNLKAVGDGILQISTDTGTSTDQLTQGMYMIESSGQHGANGLLVLKAAAEGAKTENANLDTVANALTTTLTDYGLKATDATSVMNGLTQTVADGKTHLQDLANAMGNVLPIASSLGISFPQVAGAMATMTNAGVSAQRASQNLAFAIRALSDPSSVAEKSMTSVGLSAQQLKDTLSTQGLTGAIQLVEDHVGKTFPAGSVQAVAAFKNIMGGATGYNVALELGGKNMAAYEGNVKNITAAMNQGGDSVMGWDLIQGNFNFQMDRASASINAFLIVIGQQLLPIVTPIVAGFTSMVESLTSMITGFNSGGDSGSAFSGILSAMGINSKEFNIILTTINTTFTYLKDIIGEVGTIFSTLFGAAIQMAGKIIGDFVNNDLESLLMGLNSFLYNTRDALDAVVQGLSGFLSQVEQVFGVIAPIFDNLASNAVTWGSNFINGFGSGVMSTLDGIVSVVMQVITEIEDYLGFASPARKGPGANVHKWGQGLVHGLATGMMQGIPAITDAAGNVMDVTVKAVQPTTTATTKTGSATTTNAVQPLTTGLSQKLSSGANAIAPGVAAIGAQLDTVCSTHATSASKCASSKLTTGLASSLSSGASKVKAAADTVGNSTNGVGTAADKAATTAADKLTSGLASKIKSATPKAKKAATDLGAAVAGAVPPPMTVASDAVNKVANDINTKLKAAADGAKAALAPLSPLAQNLINAFKGVGPLFDQIKASVQSAIDYMKPGLQSLADVFEKRIMPGLNAINLALGPVKQAAIDIGGAALKASIQFIQWATSADTLKKAWDFIVAAGKALMDTLGPIIAAIGPALTQAVKGCSDAWKNEMEPALKSVGDTVKQNQPLFDALGKFLGGVLVLAIGVVVGLITGLITALGGVVAGLAKALGGIVEFCAGVFKVATGFVADIYDLFTGNFGKLDSDLTTMQDGLMMMFKGAWDTIAGIFEAAFATVSGFADGFCKGITSFFQNLSDDLVGHSIIPDMINSIMDWWNKLTTFVPDLIKKVTQFFTDGWNTIKTGTETVLKAINAYWTTYTTAAEKIISDAWTKIQQIFSSAYTTYIAQPLASILTNITTWFTNLGNNFKTWGGNLIKMFADAITSGASLVTTAVTNVASTIKSILGIASPAQTGPLSTANQWMPNLMTMFASQITAGTPAVTNAAKTMASGVQGQVSQMSSDVQSQIDNIKASMSDLKTSMQQTATNTEIEMQNLSNRISNLQVTMLNTANTAATQVETVVTTTSTMAGQVATQAATTTTAASNAASASASSMHVTFTNADSASTAAASSSTSATAANTAKQAADKRANDSFDSLTEAILHAEGARQASGQSNAELNKAIANAQAAQSSLNDARTSSTATASTENKAADEAAKAYTDLVNAKGYYASAQTVAAQAAALLSHTTPKEGPMRDDDKWMVHFMDNLIRPMEHDIPRMKKASSMVASAMAGSILPASQAISKPYTITSANSLPIIVLPPMQSSSSSSSSQPQVINVDLDGKRIGKCVTNYLNKEVHVQGGTRNR